MDKPEYYDYASSKIVEDSFSVNDFKNDDSVFTIFVEGRSDEKYLTKAQELFGDSQKKYKFEWVGNLNKSGQEEFTGESSLNKIKSFIEGHPNYFPNKVMLLYDCDTNKVTENCSNKLFIKSLPKQENIKYQRGVENLLVLPDDFNYNKYYESKIETGYYGEIKDIGEFKKMRLAEDICKEISEDEQKQILKKVGQEVKNIEDCLFGDNDEEK